MQKNKLFGFRHDFFSKIKVWINFILKILKKAEKIKSKQKYGYQIQ